MKDIRFVLTENIKFFRQQAGLTQQQLAEKCGIATPYLGEVETSKKDPSIKTLTKLASALNVEVYMLFYDRKSDVKSDTIRLKDMHGDIKKIMEKLDI
jgi:transcriptional regulator with XRE-family HTH domain